MEEGRGNNYDKGWPLNAKEYDPYKNEFYWKYEPPCVGLCYMYRKMNITNPGYPFQHNGLTPQCKP